MEAGQEPAGGELLSCEPLPQKMGGGMSTSSPGRKVALADIVLINPRFRPSYWGLEHALPAWGKRANMPVTSLPLVKC